MIDWQIFRNMKKINFGQVGVSLFMGTFRNGCCVVNMSKNILNVLGIGMLNVHLSYHRIMIVRIVRMRTTFIFSSYFWSNMLFFQFVCMYLCVYWWEQNHQCYLCTKIGFFNMAFTVEHSLLPQQLHVKCEPVASVNCYFRHFSFQTFPLHPKMSDFKIIVIEKEFSIQIKTNLSTTAISPTASVNRA